MKIETASRHELFPTLRQAATAALDRKAVDLRILDLQELSDFTEYFLICSGTNERQVQAIADAVLETLRAAKVRPSGVEGYRNGRWVLLDFGRFVVHVFAEDTRAYYRLEGLWADGADITEELVA